MFFDSKLLICLSTRADQLTSRHWHPQVKLSGRGVARLPPAHQLVWVWTQNLFSGPRQRGVYHWAFTPRADSKSWGPLIWFCLIFSISWNLYTTLECACDFFSHKMSWLITVNYVIYSITMYNMGCLLWHIYLPKKAVCLFRLSLYVLPAPLAECLIMLEHSWWVQVHQAGFINVLIYGEEFIEYWTIF